MARTVLCTALRRISAPAGGAPEARPRIERCPGVRLALWLFPLSLLASGCAPEGDAKLVSLSASAEAAPASSALPRAVETAAALNDAGSPDGGDAGVVPAKVEVPSKSSGGDALPAIATAAVEAPPCPEEMALVGRFCVDRYEAHLVVDNGGVLTPHPHFERLVAGVVYRAQSAAGMFPQGYISRVEAKAACEASGKRLCSRKEWMRACQGQGIHPYPYGPKGKRGQCNTGKNHLLAEMFGSNARGGWKYDEHFNSPALNQTPGFLARSGEYPGCASELNIADMVGNLHEWVSDMVDQGLIDQLDVEDPERREQPWSVGNGVFMGGFYSTTSELGQGCFYTTVAHEPRYHDYSTGFRCCSAARFPAVTPASSKKGRKPG